MFVAWRDLRHARGRFVLIASVVALITVLVGFLAGLTGGLAAQNVSAVLALPGDRLVLQQPAEGRPSFSTSAIDQTIEQAWRTAPGVQRATPIGIVQGRAAAAPSPTAVPVAFFGLPHGSSASPVADLAPAGDDEVGLSAQAAIDLDVGVGDSVAVGDGTYRVAAIGADLWYSHTPAVVLTPTSWAEVDRNLGGDGLPTVLAVAGSPAWDSVAAATHTSVNTPLLSLTALETFQSEIGSLALMIAMLFGVSALVVGAFFTVWTMQRAGDIAVLKALGASTGSLIRDALGQSLVVLAAGIGLGLAVVVGVGMAIDGALPFLLSPLTTLLPALVMTVLGLAGGAFALRTVTSADPLTALGSIR
ncbi:ABC transporter permease [Klenkia terrae]|uniref:ABC transporter permease n=1 Tax=Klenkia terrae TaxID=1052259 RepID=A0ABU8E585_9ACTN|nr:ABC transporter permease [Klenkia terrae]